MISEGHKVKKPFIYVVTLTWNQKADALACLESLSQMTYPNFRLLLVDNASIDSTVEAVRESYPEVEIIINPENLGFPGGFNVGIKHAVLAGADFVLIINNDTYVKPDMLDQLVAKIDRPDIGILSPKIYYAAEPNRIWSVGADRGKWTLDMIDHGRGQIDNGQWSEVVEQEYLVGCAMLLSRSLLIDVGLLDTGYNPIYFEDIDLCLRARRAGYRLLMVPGGQMWHKVAASGGGTDSPRVRYLMSRNSIRFYRKHARGKQWLVVIPFRVLSSIKTTFRLIGQRKFQSMIAHLRGIWDGLTMTLIVDEDQINPNSDFGPAKAL